MVQDESELKNGSAPAEHNKSLDKSKMAVGNGSPNLNDIDQIKKVCIYITIPVLYLLFYAFRENTGIRGVM